ncbi:MAG: 30S ribosomal protein S6 [bacterium]|nr:30S ribosomal protein S6 [bacterium]
MAEEAVMEKDTVESDEVLLRVYEVGYHLAPTVKEEELEGVVGGIRSVIEKVGGSFIAEGAPTLTRLAFPISVVEKGKRSEYDRGYFGWIKFEASIDVVEKLNTALTRSADIIRSIIFQTVREDTRARIKAPTLRDVKRTDVIKSTTRHAAEVSAPVSEEDLEKALKDITEE